VDLAWKSLERISIDFRSQAPEDDMFLSRQEMTSSHTLSLLSVFWLFWSNFTRHTLFSVFDTADFVWSARERETVRRHCHSAIFLKALIAWRLCQEFGDSGMKDREKREISVVMEMNGILFFMKKRWKNRKDWRRHLGGNAILVMLTRRMQRLHNILPLQSNHNTSQSRWKILLIKMYYMLLPEIILRGASIDVNLTLSTWFRFQEGANKRREKKETGKNRSTSGTDLSPFPHSIPPSYCSSSFRITSLFRLKLHLSFPLSVSSIQLVSIQSVDIFFFEHFHSSRLNGQNDWVFRSLSRPQS